MSPTQNGSDMACMALGAAAATALFWSVTNQASALSISAPATSCSARTAPVAEEAVSARLASTRFLPGQNTMRVTSQDMSTLGPAEDDGPMTSTKHLKRAPTKGIKPEQEAEFKIKGIGMQVLVAGQTPQTRRMIPDFNDITPFNQPPV